ncbi:hypothetical protein Z945_980 [Sulfitobacter noctilucae]|uniref:hypothetical protein n=1 Tax=Sulfitobacter noctilucae TaxID=1342302 RepID=UPI000469D9C6|nr:hypothetical protein [Sulfitobacter noctilucae]KIN65933.1 hypothetical protein Z945_980 [Sulfitobacter noctilucae]
MKIRYILIFLIFFAMPMSVAAQQAKILSGEHRGFTRLVAPLPIGAEWSISHIDREVKIVLPVPQKGFDISEVFDLIPRARIAKINLLDNGFMLTLGCDCLVAPFVAQERFIVIDVTSPGVSRTVPFIKRNHPAEEEVEAVVSVGEDSVKMPPAQSNSVTLPLIAPRKPDALTPETLPILARSPLSQLEEDTLEEIQQRLARELGTAATRGMLTPLPGAPVPSAKSKQADPAIELRAKTLKKPEVVGGLVNNMRISSSRDIPELELGAQETQSLSGLQCPADALINPADWVNDSGFIQQTGKVRQALYGEFDRLNLPAALELAKLYLHYGFGAEAIQVLELDPALASQHSMLIDIAHIMEHGEARPESNLPQLLDCTSDVALWAILARPTIGVAKTIDPKPALLALNKQPVHLRQFLAPALSRRFLSHGDTEAAASALRNLQRLPSPLNPPAKLAQASIEIEDGDVQGGTATLAAVVEDNTEQSPEALIALIDARLSANQPIDVETAGLVEAYAKELSGSELGAELRRAHVLALVKSGQFDRAIEASIALGGADDEPASIKLRLQLLEELTATANDVVFLDHVFAQSPKDIKKLPIRPKLDLAHRLVDLGFSLQAEEVIGSVPTHPRNEQRQILAGRIALDLGQPMRAQSELAEISGETADALRASAKEMAGAHKEAYAIYNDLQNAPAAIQSAWLAEDTEALALTNDTVFSPVLALDGSAIPPSAEISGMLARTTAAIDESASARDALSNMLNSPETRIGPSSIGQ